MIEMKHYVAHWEMFDADSYYNGGTSVGHKHERFRSKQEAEKKVAEELEKFKAAPVSSTEWFKEWYLVDLDTHFKVTKENEIY